MILSRFHQNKGSHKDRQTFSTIAPQRRNDYYGISTYLEFITRMTPLQETLAKKFFDIGAVRFGNFSVKSTPDANMAVSPLSLDLRVIRSYPDVMDIVTEALQEESRSVNFDLIADIPTAATPFVSLLSQKTRVPMITPRIRKDAESEYVIEGSFVAGQKVLLVDDIVKKAESKLAAIGILESFGLSVRDIIVLIDQEQGGNAQLSGKGYQLHAMFRLSDLLKYYLQKRKIKQSTFNEVRDYFLANAYKV